MVIHESLEAKKLISKYPKLVQERLLFIRTLIFELATELELVKELTEALKWGEPSYLANGGSTIRLGWSAKNPSQYGIYYTCTTKLGPHFKKIYPDTFKFEKNRAIIFDLKEAIPVDELKQCLTLALTYKYTKKTM